MNEELENNHLEEELNTNTNQEASHVRPVTKYFAMILFVLLPFVGGWIGYQMAPEKVVEVEKVAIKEIVENSDEWMVSEADRLEIIEQREEEFADKISKIQQLPFGVYEATYIPEGMVTTDYSLQDYFKNDSDDHYIRTYIGESSSGEQIVYDTYHVDEWGKNLWVSLHQRKLKVENVGSCLPIEHTDIWDKGEINCEVVGETSDGQKIYKATKQTLTRTFEIVLTDVDSTRIIFDSFDDTISDDEVSEITQVIESFRKFESEELADQMWNWRILYGDI